MKLLTRPLRAFLLAWSLLLTTQLALVHGYVHQQQVQSGANRQAGGDPEKAVHEQLCKQCASLSQLGTALPSHATPVVLAAPAGEVLATSFILVASEPPATHPARGPPVQS